MEGRETPLQGPHSGVAPQVLALRGGASGVGAGLLIMYLEREGLGASKLVEICCLHYLQTEWGAEGLRFAAGAGGMVPESVPPPWGGVVESMDIGGWCICLA